MNIWEQLVSFFHKYVSIPSISVTDIIEILIIAFILYYLIIWFRKTSAWTLFKGIIVVLLVILLAAIFNLETIVWIASKTLSVGIVALIVIFQPELRRALEQIGKRRLLSRLTSRQTEEKLFTDHTLDELVTAAGKLSKARTGALICIEQNISLGEYERTGIKVDAEVSAALLLNIFENKTPLHDGAVIIRDNRIAAATCYLPMSESGDLDKKYGTRHRAALGLSEKSDALTIVVSEETGGISIAVSSSLIENLDSKSLRNRLTAIQNYQAATNWFDKFKKGGRKDENQEVSSEVHSE